MSYNFREIDQKWQNYWDENKTFFTDVWDFSKPKFYALDMFPYPSGAGLHVGHVRNFSIVDCVARFYAQNDYNVLRPFGYDTFGLPAENYAIKTGTAPQDVTITNINNFRKQANVFRRNPCWGKTHRKYRRSMALCICTGT